MCPALHCRSPIGFEAAGYDLEKRGAMDGGGETELAGGPERVTEGRWAGWSWYPRSDAFEELAGPFYFRDSPAGARVCAFLAEPRHMNGSGFMHGGCVMTFADFALFVIAREAMGDQRGVTVTLNGEFLGASRAGDVLECTGEVVKTGRSLVFVRGLITTSGQPVMSFSGVIKKMGPRLPRP